MLGQTDPRALFVICVLTHTTEMRESHSSVPDIPSATFGHSFGARQLHFYSTNKSYWQRLQAFSVCPDGSTCSDKPQPRQHRTPVPRHSNLLWVTFTAASMEQMVTTAQVQTKDDKQNC